MNGQLNNILNRDIITEEIIKMLKAFDDKKATLQKKGIYIYGPPGSGKTEFVKTLLKQLNYDIILYNAGDIRNKTLFQQLDSNHISNRNVLDLMNRKIKKIAIVMDEIDGMNNGDKGGIDALIKLVRQKKTKKQKLENTTMNPIFCIGNHEQDKKIRELMKACFIFELRSPNRTQMTQLLKTSFPEINEKMECHMLDYIQGDLRKLKFLCELGRKKPSLLNSYTLQSIFQIKLGNEDAKKITWKLLQKNIPLKDHTIFMNETDRTTVSLLWHENIASCLSPLHPTVSFPFYNRLLDNICFADYISRITFQSQIWQFNEMGSLVKTFYNNKLYHEQYPLIKHSIKLEEIEFTKVLTKYSTEYNNQLFLLNIGQKLNMDKKDCNNLFQELRIVLGETFYNDNEKMYLIRDWIERSDLDLLDIKRMYRFLDKNTKKEMDDFKEDDESLSDTSI